MSDLSPSASGLLEAARRAPRAPSKEAVERMERVVMVATGVTAAAGAGAAKTVWAWVLPATGKSVIGAVAITLAGAAATVALVETKPAATKSAPRPDSLPVGGKGSTDEPRSADPLPAGAGSGSTAPAPESLPAPHPDPLPAGTGRGSTAPEPESLPAPRVKSAPHPAGAGSGSTAELIPPPSPPAVSSLGSEVALLQSAKSKLEAGDWAAVQVLLDQHHAQFPEAALGIEADVLRVLAWCGAGQLSEASALATQVRERAPRAPATARLAGSCVDQ